MVPTSDKFVILICLIIRPVLFTYPPDLLYIDVGYNLVVVNVGNKMLAGKM